MADVFISYAREDLEFVRRLVAALTERKHGPRYDMDEILPSEEFWPRIRGLVDEADAVLFVITPRSVKSAPCRRELEYAASGNKRIIPILREQVADEVVPEPAAARQWIFLREPDDFAAEMEKLFRAIDTDPFWLRRHAALLVRAREWEAQQRERGRLLRGAQLAQAEAFLAEGAGRKESQPTRLQTEYILASRRAATRRQRVVAAVSVVVAVVVLALALVARQQRDRAIEQANIARARELIAEAQKGLERSDFDDLRRSVLAAVESVRLYASEEGDDVLRRALRLLARGSATVAGAGKTRVLAARDDGQFVLAERDGHDTVVVRDLTHGATARRFSPSAPIDAFALATDASVLALAAGPRVHVMDVNTGAELSSVDRHDETGTELLLTVARDRLVVAGGSRIEVYAFKASAPLLAVNLAADATAVAVSRDGQHVAVATGDSLNGISAVRSWNLAGRGELPVVELKGVVRALALSGAGERLVAGTEYFGFGTTYGELHAWEAMVGRPRVIHRADWSGVSAVSCSRDGRWIAAASDVEQILVFDPVTELEVARLGPHAWSRPTTEIRSLVFDPSGNRLTSASDQEVRTWELALNRTLSPERAAAVSSAVTSWRAHGEDSGVLDHALDATLSPGGEWFYVNDQVLNSATGELQISLPQPAGPIAFSSDGHWFAVADGPAIIIWDVATRQEVRRLSMTADVHALTFAGRRLVTNGAMMLTLWDIESGAALQTIAAGQPTAVLQSSPDGRWVAEVGKQSVRVLDAGTLRPTFSTLGVETPVAIAFSADGASFALHDGRTVRVWQLPTGKLRTQFAAIDQRPRLAFDPHGAWIAASRQRPQDQHGDQALVQHMDSYRGPRVLTPAHDFQHLALSPGGRWAAFIGGNAVTVWEVSSGRSVADIEYEDWAWRTTVDSTGRAVAVGMTPTGEYVAAGAADGTATQWIIWPDDIAASACARLGTWPTGPNPPPTLDDRTKYLAVCDEPGRIRPTPAHLYATSPSVSVGRADGWVP